MNQQEIAGFFINFKRYVRALFYMSLLLGNDIHVVR